MKELAKRTAAAALAGVMMAGMLTGCGEKKLDGTKTVVTVDGTEIPMGVVSLAARHQQTQVEYMYKMYFGESSVWDNVYDDESGETYGEETINSVLKDIELMYIMKEKAADYGAELTEEDEAAIAEAAAAFMEANSEETIETLAVTEDQVKTYLELQTYQQRVHDALRAEAEVEVTDEEANQSSFTYVSISTSSEDLTDEDKEKLKANAQEILNQMKEDPEADMDETAKAVDESYSASTGTFTAHKSEDEEETSSYPAEVLDALREVKDGEMVDEVIETDTAYYVARLDLALDEDATESKRESLDSSKRDEYYTEITEQWLSDADIKVEEKVLDTLTMTDSHKFSMPTATPTPSPAAEDMEVEEETEASEESVGDAEAETTEDEEAEAEEETTEADAEVTEEEETAETDGADAEEEGSETSDEK